MNWTADFNQWTNQHTPRWLYQATATISHDIKDVTGVWIDPSIYMTVLALVAACGVLYWMKSRKKEAHSK